MRSTPPESDAGVATPSGRRADVRVVVHLDATVDDGKVTRMYRTQNLSRSGMLLCTRRPLPVGTCVSIQFLFPGDPTLTAAELPGGYGFVEGKARVVRHTHPARERIEGMALQFLALEQRGRQSLSDFLQIKQRPYAPPLPA